MGRSTTRKSHLTPPDSGCAAERKDDGDPMYSEESRAAATSALVRHLSGRQRAGEDQVWLTEEARRDLAKIREQNRANPTPRQDKPTGQRPLEHSHPPATGEQKQTAAKSGSADATSSQFSRIRENLNQRDVPKPRSAPALQNAAPSQQDVRNISPAEATGTSKRDRLDSLIALASSCPRCLELGTFRETMVFATGDPDAEIMFVGEAPGAEEEIQKEPFVGPAGQLLTKIIGAAGLDRSKVYISNICKYRPRLPNQTSNNRKPTAEEMEACLPYVLAEVDIINPKVIVALGGTALEGLLGTAMSVALGRETNHEFRSIPLIVTYHPSYLLRNTAISERRKVWEDMMRAMEIVGLPITEKQRNFFRGR